MKTAVIGCGNISGCHFKAIEKIDGAVLSAVADIKKERAENAAEKYGCKAYTDYIKMLDEEKPDCVHICTPHYLHDEMAAQALRRGINVLSEKPCAISLDGLEKIKAALAESGAQYGVCFQNRYNESVLTAKKITDSREYGNIVCVRALVHWKREKEYYCDDWHGKKDKEGGGVLINQAVHTLDLMRYILGEDMKSVSGHIFNEKFGGLIEVEDTVSARFETQSGITALLSATVAAGCDHPVMIDIVCENAVLRIEGNNAYRIKDGDIQRLYLDGSTAFSGRKYWGNGHESLIADFYDSVKTGRKFLVDFSEAEKSVREFVAVYTSAKRDEKVNIQY